MTCGMSGLVPSFHSVCLKKRGSRRLLPEAARFSSCRTSCFASEMLTSNPQGNLSSDIYDRFTKKEFGSREIDAKVKNIFFLKTRKYCFLDQTATFSDSSSERKSCYSTQTLLRVSALSITKANNEKNNIDNSLLMFSRDATEKSWFRHGTVPGNHWGTTDGGRKICLLLRMFLFLRREITETRTTNPKIGQIVILWHEGSSVCIQ